MHKFYFGDVITLRKGSRSVKGLVIEPCAKYGGNYVVLFKRNLYSMNPQDIIWNYKMEYVRAKMKYLFSQTSLSIRSSILYDNVSLYSATDQITARSLAKRMLQLPGISRDSIVTDATACIGGNTIAFC